jgi:hypothetical protein
MVWTALDGIEIINSRGIGLARLEKPLARPLIVVCIPEGPARENAKIQMAAQLLG